MRSRVMVAAGMEKASELASLDARTSPTEGVHALDRVRHPPGQDVGQRADLPRVGVLSPVRVGSRGARSSVQHPKDSRSTSRIQIGSHRWATPAEVGKRRTACERVDIWASS